MASIVDIQPDNTNPIAEGIDMMGGISRLKTASEQRKLAQKASGIAERKQELSEKDNPLMVKIAQQNADIRQKTLDHSVSRFSNPGYLYTKMLRSLPAATRAKVLHDNPQVAGALIDKYGQQAVDSFVNNGGSGNPNHPFLPPSNPYSDSIKGGAAEDFDKASHTSTAVNRSIYGKNVRSTLDGIISILPTIAKYTGIGGEENKIGSSLESSVGITPSNDYQTYNTFSSTLVPRLASQLRQFYGDSVQPGQIKARINELKPRIGETSTMYTNRVNTLLNIMKAETAQQEQPYSQIFTKKPIGIDVAGTNDNTKSNTFVMPKFANQSEFQKWYSEQNDNTKMLARKSLGG